MLSCLPARFGGHPIIRQWIPKGIPFRRGKPIPRDGLPPRQGAPLADVKGVVIGDTGYRGLIAQAAASDRGQAYGHLIIDDAAIIECVPALTSGVGLVEQAHFVAARSTQGFNADESAISVNLCFGGGIKSAKTYDHCVSVVAFICWRFGLQPSAVVAARDLDPARDDPEQALRAAGKDFKTLSEDVAATIHKANEDRSAAIEPDHQVSPRTLSGPQASEEQLSAMRL